MAEDREAFVENFEETFDISTEMENRRIVLDAGPDGASGREQAHLPWLKLARPLLSLGNLLPRQLTFQHGHVLLCILIALHRRQQQPLVSPYRILRHALAIVVAERPDCFEPRRDSARRLCDTTSPPPLILRHALALVADAQIVLSLGVILLGGFAIPLHRLRLILRHALAIA